MTDGFPRRFGKYHLLAPLAQGGMGALYLACTGDRGLEKLCVIKTVLPHLADSEYVARFRDEAKVVVKLSHGNLVPVFDAGQVGGEIFLAMDFVEGKDLRAVWNRCAKKGVAFPIDIAVFIVKELCRGLAYAHGYSDLKLVHRDISPPNVLVSFSGEVKLTDFGLASSTLKLEKTAPGVIYGKVSYMSPEQARGEPLDGRTDLYAAAIILWELLTGRQLFPPSPDQPQDLVARSKDPNPDPPSKRAPRVPAALDEIVMKALRANPNERYQSGEEFRQALAGWLAKEAPATDSARLEKFVTSLFVEDLTKERAEREAMLVRTRDRILTKPPSDAIRDAIAPPDAGPGVAGRPNLGVAAGKQRAMTSRGVVAVPPPQANGSTVPLSGAHAVDSAALAMDTDSVETDVVGQVIDGRYHVRCLLGEGGMGRVYEAEHVEIGKRVALKILHPVYSRTPEVVARFRREARAASKIGHPNIVDVTDSGTTADGSVYFVMEYLEGVELAAVIDREGALDIHRALNVSAQICRALAAAHNAGIIHRDLKPENVFLIVREGTTDFVKVLDFGIAKSAEFEEQRKERLTHPGMAMGTPEYMAPEQAAGKPADARSDVYAAGAILYEMLTGRPPYTGENFMEILTRKATQEPKPPRELRPDVPDVVEKLVLRALARDAAQRPPSMESFEYELTKCLAGRGVAVAKVLGLTLDPSMLDGGDDHVRSNPPDLRTNPALISPVSAPAPVATQPSTDVSTSVAPELSGTTVVLNRRSMSSIFIYLFLLVGAAAGVYFYVTRAGRGGGHDPTPTAAVTSSPGAADRDDPSKKKAVADKDKKPEKKDPPREASGKPEREKEKEKEKEREKEKVASTPGEKEKEREKDKEKEKVASGPPKSAKEAGQILAEAKGAEVQMQWQKARSLYDRVASGDHRRADGLLGMANVAFQTKDTDAAIDLAKSALGAGAGDNARMLLGHAYFKKGRYTDAIAEYKAVLKKNPNHREAQKALREADKQRRER